MSLLVSYTKTLPEGVPISEYLKEKADGYIVVQVSGKPHFVPLTKSMKKRFHIRRKKDDIEFDDFKEEKDFDDIVRTIANALYLQARDTIGVEIREDVVGIVTGRIRDLLNPIVDKEIDDRFEKKLLNAKSEETNIEGKHEGR